MCLLVFFFTNVFFTKVEYSSVRTALRLSAGAVFCLLPEQILLLLAYISSIIDKSKIDHKQSLSYLQATQL